MPPPPSSRQANTTQGVGIRIPLSSECGTHQALILDLAKPVKTLNKVFPFAVPFQSCRGRGATPPPPSSYVPVNAAEMF